MALSMERALSDPGQWRASITYRSRCLDHTSNGVGLYGEAGKLASRPFLESSRGQSPCVVA